MLTPFEVAEYVSVVTLTDGCCGWDCSAAVVVCLAVVCPDSAPIISLRLSEGESETFPLAVNTNHHSLDSLGSLNTPSEV